MKKIFKILFILYLSIFTFPILVNASTYLSTSTNNPIVGQDFNVSLNIDYAGKKISQASYIISYNNDMFSLKKLNWMHNVGTYYVETVSDYDYIYIEKENDGKYWNTGIPVELTFEVKKTGEGSIRLKENGKAYYENGDEVNQQIIDIPKITAKKPSSNKKLHLLYVEGYKISPTFSNNITSYNVIVESDVAEVTVKAEPLEDGQTITGTGVRKLDYGDNRVDVVVRAEDGTTRTYQVMIHRTDNRTGDTTLKSLTVTNTKIAYEKDVTSYQAEVGKDVDKVLIKATPNDGFATVSGDIGEKKLNIGENIFKINVESSGNKTQTYTITINKLNRIIEPEKPSSKLASLSVNGIGVNLDNEFKTYTIGVESDVEELDIIQITESSTAKVEIIGNESLKVGTNKVIIKVTETNGEFMEYTLIVYKNPASATIIEDIIELNTKNTDLLYNTKKVDTIDVSLLKKFLKKDNKLYYNVVDNNNNGILYRLVFNQNVNLENIDNLDLSFKENEKDSLNYETSLPANINVDLYLNNLYLDETNLRIYTYDEGTGYKLLTAGTTVNNGYISFKTDGSKYYLITQSVLIPEDDVITRFFQEYKTFFIVAILGTIILIILAIIINKKQKQIESKEPEY